MYFAGCMLLVMAGKLVAFCTYLDVPQGRGMPEVSPYFLLFCLWPDVV